MAQFEPVLSTQPLQAPGAWLEACTRFLARQPIVDRQRRLLGYELLFRNSRANLFPGGDADAATCHVIDSTLLSGWAELTAGSPAFINCTRNVLLSDVLMLLPPDFVIAEVLEDVPADDEMVAACERLHRAGYTIALDDFVGAEKSMRLLRCADIVKVDLLATTQAQQVSIAEQMRGLGVRLLAEKVESREQFRFAQRLGYDFFQGYYFSRPEPLTITDSAPSSGEAYLRALTLAEDEPYDVEKLEQAILGEPSLCYRLLRYLDLAHFQLSTVRSVRQALELLGQGALRQILKKLMQVALCREYQSWMELPAIAGKKADTPAEQRLRRKGPKSAA